MFHYRDRCLLIVLFIVVHASAIAQTSSISNPTNQHENDPYSKFGIGGLLNGNNVVLRGMGNVTSAYENPYQINSDNPASYSFLERTTFDVGAYANTSNVTSSGLSYGTGTASVAYLNIAVPLKNWGGLCFGFRPYSHVFYALADTIPTAQVPSPIGEVIRFYGGEGGLNYGFVGGAVKYYGLSLGFNAGYLFGTIRSTTQAIPSDSLATNRAYTAEFTNFNRIGDLYWKGGAMWEQKLDSGYTFRVGATLNIAQNVSDRLNAFQIASFNFGDSIIRDTSSNPGQQKGKVRMPLSFSAGVMLAKNDKWNVGFDYSAANWSKFRSTPDTTFTFGVGNWAYKASIGAEYTPDINNIRNYFSRVTYRLGAYYGHDYLNLNNTPLPTYGVTAGTSLPFRRSLSRLHLAVDVGRLGTTNNNLILETYVRFSIGVSLNDKWFIPRKYD